MSDEAGTDTEVEQSDEEAGDGQPRIGCLASMIPVTTPGCASLLTAVFLITTVITVWIVFWLDPDNIPWRHSYSLWRILGIVGLGILLPIIVYKTLRLWLEVPPKAFPELEYAWRAGIHALASNELSVDSVPLFLVTGSSGESQEKAIMSASGLRLSVEGVPQGAAPIHWYANSEAIYLFCSDASWTSALASLREELAQDAMALGINVESTSHGGSKIVAPVPASAEVGSAQLPRQAGSELRDTAEPSQLYGQSRNESVPSPPQPRPGNVRGTLDLNQFYEASKPVSPLSSPSAGSSRAEPSSLSGTMKLESRSASTVSATGSNKSQTLDLSGTWPGTYAPQHSNASKSNPDYAQWTLAPASDVDSNRKPILVSHQYSTACLQELQHLGQLVRHARQPVCPINGVLALIQIESIHSSPVELEELQKAIHGDMETIRRAFQIRVPVSALVVGLEKERGFRELVRRVGRDRALSQRFGKRFDVLAIPFKEELVALAMHICGVFEDWAYALFREEEALTRTGNTRLYELLSKVRCSWKTRLGELLAGGFGCERDKSAQDNALFMSGCYLAATGETPDRQAFVKGVIEKLAEEQELIEWTPEAVRASKFQGSAAKLGMLLTLGLLISLMLMYFFL